MKIHQSIIFIACYFPKICSLITYPKYVVAFSMETTSFLMMFHRGFFEIKSRFLFHDFPLTEGAFFLIKIRTSLDELFRGAILGEGR